MLQTPVTLSTSCAIIGHSMGMRESAASTGCSASRLFATELFRDFSRKELERLLAGLPYSIRNHRRGELVFLRGQSYTRLLVILSGELAAEMETDDGKHFVPWFIGSSKTIASGLLFACNNTLPVSLRAKTDTTILSIPRGSVLALWKRSSKFQLAFLQDVGAKLREMAGKLWLMEFASLRQKVAVYLHELAAAQADNAIRLPCTKTEIADHLGAARASLSRTLKELAAEGMISTNGRVVRILDTERLKTLLPRL